MTDWGNYEGYQGVARHFPGSPSSPHVKDPRLCLLEALIPDIFRASKVGDIGCNAGAVTVQLALNFDAASVTGVDIDENLIKQARSHLSFRSSRVRPATHETARATDYFPISAVLQHGHRSQHLVSRDAIAQTFNSAISPSQWPEVTFVCEDWAVSNNPATSGPFHVLLALSVIKWIHLEHLDGGLEAFFKKCASSLVEGGYLVLEIQPWKSYEKAVGPKKSPHFRENLKRIKHRPETSFTELLEQHGLFHFAMSEELPRRISVYRKHDQQDVVRGG
ncbi:S-adenosyl-L-methionine-dependent methyltransferase [Cenococcum geophilum 1.58]|uniref:S-adenosyl-L-methionine-dependent methyltransferase n=1 Tax=Cenococcum geophilum 1.58 TaxID=794803 RepID=UPI00358E9621|nr:S-adenosyl-L-methionine-dependent methyltransferase [Cenococcum geophilum 1.58]